MRMFHGDYPLTDEAAARRSAWDAGDSSLLECTEWNMPYLMYDPLPMDFLRHGDDILLRFEEDGNERLVHMTADPGNGAGVHTLLGHSIGRWEGDTLAVVTTKIEANVLDIHGTPFSFAIHLVERFTPSADGSRLDYWLTITDPGDGHRAVRGGTLLDMAAGDRGQPLWMRGTTARRLARIFSPRSASNPHAFLDRVSWRLGAVICGAMEYSDWQTRSNPSILSSAQQSPCSQIAQKSSIIG